MPFRGFLIESKSYMSYERMSKSERVRFWFRFPFAWFRFQWSGLTYACSGLVVRARQKVESILRKGSV